MIAVIRQFHDGIQVCMRLYDRFSSGGFAVEQGLRQGCVLTARLLDGGYKRVLYAFQGERRHHGRFGTPREEKGGGEATAGEPILATLL